VTPTTTDANDPTLVEADWTRALPPPPSAPDARRPTGGRRRRRSRSLLVIGVAFAALSVAYGCIILLDLLAGETSTVGRTFAGVEQIELASHCGGVTIVGDRPAGASTTVSRKVRRGLQEPDADETLNGSTLRLHTSCPVFPQTFNEVTYEVHVPPGVAVAGSASGKIRLTDVDGPIDLRATDGGIDVTGAEGRLSLHSGSGGIHVVDSSGQMVLSTSDGGIRAEGVGATSVVARTGAGGITLDLLDAPDRIDASTGDGGIDVTLPADAPAYATTTDTGDGSVANTIRTDPTAPRTITARTGNGGITLRLRSGG